MNAKRSAGRFSQETYRQYRDKAEMLRNELKAREGIAERQKALEQNRESILKQIQQLENDADGAMKADRKERMKAIQLIQENNDVAAMYKAKKAELREFEGQTGGQKYQQQMSGVVEEYETRQEKLEDYQSRYSELEEQNEGNSIRNLALIFPVAALAVIVWIAGGLVV